MLPIRVASSSRANRRCCLYLVLLLGGAAIGPVEGGPLKGRDLNDFRALIDPPKALTVPVRAIHNLDAAGLATYLEKLHEAARSPRYLPSLGDVSEVLLSTEWDSEGFSYDSRVLLKPVKDAVLKAMTSEDYRAFQEDVQRLMRDPDAVGNPDGFRRTVVGEIKRQVRLDLLDRLEKGMHAALSKERDASSRIAAANLVSRIMTTLRREDFAKSIIVDENRSTASSSVRDLPQRLRDLSGDLRELLADSNPEVQVAGVRALSELGLPAEQLSAAFKPLLTSSQTAVVARRATADALLHVLDVMAQVAEQRSTRNRGAGTRENPLSPFRDTVNQLETIQRILPVAVLGLDDSDAEVRGRCLRACHRSAMLVDDLARHLARDLTSDLTGDLSSSLDLSTKGAEELLAGFRKNLLDAFLSTLAVADRSLSKINAAASDPVPNLRVLACRVLETFALTAQRVRDSNKQILPLPQPEPSTPDEGPPLDDKKTKGVRSPSGRGGRRPNAMRPSQWAAARVPQSAPQLLPLPLPSDSAAPAVTLDRPIQLPVLSSESQVLSSKKHLEVRSQKSEVRNQKSEVRTDTVRLASFAAPRMDELPSPTPVKDPWPRTVEIMINNLSHRDYRVRLGAVDTLETLEDQAEPAIPALVKALEDSNKFVRWGSARTLGRFATRRKDKTDPFYGRYADKIVTGLIPLLNDQEDPSVRITVAYALEQYGETAKKAVSHLARVVNRGDKDYILAILHTIQGIGTDAAPALPNVAWLLSDRTQPTSVRIEAAKTLGLFGELAKEQPRVLSVLRDVMLNDSYPDVRNAASTALLAIERPLK